MEKAWKGGEVQKLRDGERRKRDALRLRDLLPHSLTLVRPSRHDQIRKVVVLVQQPELGLRVLEAPDLTVLEEAGGPAGGGEGFTDDSGLRRRGTQRGEKRQRREGKRTFSVSSSTQSSSFDSDAC
jgi:hypothetical protein